VKEMPVPPFRVFGATARTPALPSKLVLLWNRPLVQSFHPLKYCRYWFDSPALPLTLASAVRFFLNEVCWQLLKSPNNASLRASPSFRVLPSHTYPVRLGGSGPLMGFCSLQHIRRRRSTCCGFAGPLRSAFRVWLPSWRLAPCGCLAGFISHRQRSWDSPFGGFSPRKVSGALPPGRTHIPSNLSLLPSPKRWAGPTDPGFWVLTLPRVPGDHTVV